MKNYQVTGGLCFSNSPSNKYSYLQGTFSFCETAESKNKIHAFDTTVVRGCGMYEKLVSLYKMKSTSDVSKFDCQEKGKCYDT